MDYRRGKKTVRHAMNQFAVIGGIILSCVGTNSQVVAQISPDNTLVNPTTVTQSGNDFTITGGTQAGNNLFHSFTEFSVPTEGSAFFDNAASIKNIISRVTGDLVSKIDGLIKANHTANLFLLNPNGIIFGPHASLNIGGSFVASTANSLKLNNGNEFSATNPTTPLLTLNVPTGLQFGSKAEEIKVQTQSPLQVESGNTLALIGGNISLENAQLSALGGRVELGSVGSDSLVSITPTALGLTFGYENVEKFQNIGLQQSGVQDSGEIAIRAEQLTINNSSVKTSTSGSATGDLTFEVGNLIIQGRDAIVSTETRGEGKGGNVNIRADDVELGDLALLGTQTEGSGVAGDVNINTRTLRIRDGAQIVGGGKIVEIMASDSVELTGTGSTEKDGTLASGLFAKAGDAGVTGEVNVDTGKLIIQDGAQVSASTSSSSNASNVTINAREVELRGTDPDGEAGGVFSQVEEGATGQGGDITIDTATLRIEDGAQIGVSTFDTGDAGSLEVTASDSVEIRGDDPKQSSSGLFAQVDSEAKGNGGNITIDTGQLLLSGSNAVISTSTRGSGDGGNITITTRQLQVHDGAQVQSATQGQAPGGEITVNASDSIELFGTSTTTAPSGLITSTGDIESDTNLGEARAGDLIVNTGTLLIEDGARISASTFNQGQGGNITINASEAVKLIGTSANGELNSSLIVEATQSGKAGKINLTASSLLLDQQGAIIATTAANDGGNIELKIDKTLLLRRNSLISANAGGGNGGNIDIDTTFIVAIPSEDSDITANAIQGKGGNLNISAQGIFGIEFREQENPATSDITASSESGPQFEGIVNINTPNVNPSQGLVNLPVNVVNVSQLVARSCGTGGKSVSRRFIVTGRGGLPPNPGETLSEATILADLGSPAFDEEKHSTATYTIPESTQIVEAQGWVINADGKVVLTAQASSVTPHSLWQTGATCHRS